MHAFISVLGHDLLKAAGILLLLAVVAVVWQFVRSASKQGNSVSWSEEYGLDEVREISRNFGNMIRRGLQYIWHHPPGGFRSS